MQGFLLLIIFIFLSVGVEAVKYHQVPDHLFNHPNFLNARFPNHPFFPNQRKAPISPLFEEAQCKEYYFSEQIIDHFNSAMPPLNSTTYSQRYFVCDGFWDKNSSSPIFFYTGNESDVELYVNNTGLMFELAPDFNALIVFAEHRYFGKSLPFGSLTPKYMNYLTMEQALADYAHFLRWFTETNNIDNPPIITFGGSYGGMLSAWFRMKYPGSVDGAISGSAPVLGFLGLSPPYDQTSFAAVETDDASPAQGASAECATNVRQAFDFIFELSTTPAGLKQLTADLMLCNPLESTDVSILVNWLKSAWDFMTMGDYPYATSYMTNGAGALPPYPTIVACEYLSMTSNDQTTILTAAREAISVFYNVSGQYQCYDIKQSVNNATLYEMIYWDYLRCNELLVPYGWTGTSDMFWNETFNLEQQLEICKATWGVDTDAYKIAETYGGIQAIEAASNIVFSNGVLDPWHPGGVLTNVSDTVLAVLMEGSAHHLDLLWSNPLDPQSVINGRLLEKANIQIWVDQKLANKKKSQHL